MARIQNRMKQEHALGSVSLSLGGTSLWIIPVLLSGFVVRFLWWAYAKPIPVSDFEGYRRLAEGLLKYGQFGFPHPSAYRLPGYPMFLSVIMAISDSTEWLSFVNVVLSTLLILIVYRLAFYLTSEKVPSVIAALICVLNPTFVFFSPVLASEHLFVIFFFSAFLVLFNNDVSLSIGWVGKPLLAGILFGIAVLTRGEGVFVLPILLALTYLTFRGSFHKYPSVLVLVLALVVTIAPWYVRNHYLVGPGSGLSTSAGINFYYAHNENRYGWHPLRGIVFRGKDEVQRQRVAYRLGFEYLAKASPLRIAKDIERGTEGLFLSSSVYSVDWSTRLPKLEPGVPYRIKRLRGIYWFRRLTLAYFVLLFASVLSCPFLGRYPLRTRVFVYGIVTMNWIGCAWILWGKARYRYVSEVVFCILSAVFLCEVFKRLIVMSGVQGEVLRTWIQCHEDPEGD